MSQRQRPLVLFHQTGASGGAAARQMLASFTRYLWLGLGLCVAGFCVDSAQAKPAGPVSSTTAMALAARHLMSIQAAHGLFVYDYDLKASEPTGKNNLVRQAGTAYALGEYLLQHPSPELKMSLRRALAGLRDSSIATGEGEGRFVTLEQSLEYAKTGTTALALLAELQYTRATRDDRFKQIRSQWRDALLAMRLDGKGFQRQPGSDEESPYYNGEAWLALAYYQDTFFHQETANALAQLDTYLMEKYTATPDIGFYHWGIMAAAVRHATTRSAKFLAYIESQTIYFLDHLRPVPHPKANTCYALEGLLTAFAVLADHRGGSALLARLEQRIAIEMRKNLTLQIRPGAKVQPRLGQNILVDIPASYIGAFLGRSYIEYTRIDYTQHCLSALVKLNRNGRLRNLLARN